MTSEGPRRPVTSLRSWLRMAWRSLFVEAEWNLGVAPQPIQAFIHQCPTIRWLPPLGSRAYVADPFGIAQDCGVDIVCERFDRARGRGHVEWLRVTPDGEVVDRGPALLGERHLAYPYLIRHRGTVFMVPESHECSEVALYRSTCFPQSWERVATLVADFAGVDPTVFTLDGRWWLLCTSAEAANERLFAFHAPDLAGPWEPHAANPVKIDRSSSRPAGTPFWHDGCLHRPAQDCSIRYGGAIVINRVLRLSPKEFAEEPAARVDPDPQGPYRAGLHTLAAAGGVTLVDGKRYVFRSRAAGTRMLHSFAAALHPVLRGARGRA